MKKSPPSQPYTMSSSCLNTHPERNSIAPKLPSFMSLKSSLYHNRHSRLPPLPKVRENWLARKAHPNLFETIKLIKNEQASTEVQMIQVAAGGQPRPKKRKAVRQDEQIKRLVVEFSSGQRTLDSFLSAPANMVVDFS